jgi:hypothetical protein
MGGGKGIPNYCVGVSLQGDNNLYCQSSLVCKMQLDAILFHQQSYGIGLCIHSERGRFVKANIAAQTLARVSKFYAIFIIIFKQH